MRPNGIELLAEKLQGNLQTKQEVVIDPATIMLVITLVTEIVKAIQKCKAKPTDGLVLVNFPSEREKRVLKRKIRQKLGWRRYWKEGDAYYDATLKTGQNTTLEDLKNAYDGAGEA